MVCGPLKRRLPTYKVLGGRQAHLGNFVVKFLSGKATNLAAVNPIRKDVQLEGYCRSPGTYPIL